MGKNREKKRNPKRGKFWCKWCDMQLVSEGQRCMRCGMRDPRSREKIAPPEEMPYWETLRELRKNGYSVEIIYAPAGDENRTI